MAYDISCPFVSTMKPLAARMRRPIFLRSWGKRPSGARWRLREFLDAGVLPSLLLWGPPGAGKTTIARLLAGAAGARFVELSAVSDGVADVRRVIAEAREAITEGHKTLLFLDEAHRFSKSQQDAFLASVEEGAIILVAATTENPYSSITAPLRSRLRLLRLEALSDEDLGGLVDRALTDPRGLAGAAQLDPVARRQIIGFAAGDARRALTILDLAAAIAARRQASEISAADALAAAAERSIDLDRSGSLSAFIKSIRGNDPDGALYWLAAMLGAGEDPRVITRRLLISAGEEIGAADSRALGVAAAANAAAESVGMPEIQFPLAAATVILAGMAKSPRAGQAYFAAAAEITANGVGAVPSHLRANAKTYLHPHQAQGFDVAQEYLPRTLRGRRFYEPSAEGEEKELGERLTRLREKRGKRSE